MIVTEPAPLMPIGGADGNGLYGRQTLRGNLAYGGGPHEWMTVDAAGPAWRPTSPLVRNLANRVAQLRPTRRRIGANRTRGRIAGKSRCSGPCASRRRSVGVGSPARARSIR